jgi:hypothetical protein
MENVNSYMLGCSNPHIYSKTKQKIKDLDIA